MSVYVIFTPPVRRAWRSYKFASLDFLLRLPVGRGGVVNSPVSVFFYLSMSKVGLPLMGDTAGFFLLFSALLHII